MTDVYAPPAFQVYAREWLTDTILLTPEQQAALMNLRAHAWLAVTRGEPPCSIPNDEAKLARLSGLGARWRKANAQVLQFFRADADRLVDDELLGYRSEIEDNHRKRSKGAATTNAKRWGSESLSDRSSESHSESPSESESGRSASASASAS